MREENNERKTYTIDLTSAENVLNSPCYYLVQNDVIYVEPNASIRVKGSSGLTFLSAGSSIISVIASVVALFFVLNK
jgi:polysaccharide export outer membrane protein